MSAVGIHLTGEIGFVSYKPAGSRTKTGKTLNFPMLSCKLTLAQVPTTSGGQRVLIGNQTLWVSIKPPQKKQVVQEDAIQRFQAATQQGRRQAMFNNVTYSVWGQPARGELKASFWDIRQSTQQLHPLNLAVVQGKTKNVQGSWLYVNERYLIPGNGPKSGWHTRTIPVYLPQPLGLAQGTAVLVIGKVSAQTVDAQPFLHIVCEELHVCPD